MATVWQGVGAEGGAWGKQSTLCLQQVNLIA